MAKKRSRRIRVYRQSYRDIAGTLYKTKKMAKRASVLLIRRGF